MTPGPFLSLMPKGWYHVSYETRIQGTDETERTERPVMVYDDEYAAFQQYVGVLRKAPLTAFESEGTEIADVDKKLNEWVRRFFANPDKHLGGKDALRRDLFDLARHMAEDDNQSPTFFPFEERDNHNLDAIADKFVLAKLGREQENNALKTEFGRPDRSWKVLYYRYDLFKTHYDACVNRLLDAREHGMKSASHTPIFTTPEIVKDREPSPKLARQIKERDNNACLCCGYRKYLQVDHIAASYFGGNASEGNLQTLCKNCNVHKGISNISFRNDKTTLREVPSNLPDLPLPEGSARLHPPTKLESFLRRTVNFLYKCSAVSRVKIGKRGDSYRHWTITLKPGNPPEWLTPDSLKSLAARIRRARMDAGLEAIPKKITIR